MPSAARRHSGGGVIGGVIGGLVGSKGQKQQVSSMTACMRSSTSEVPAAIFWEVCERFSTHDIIGAWYMEIYPDTTFSSNPRIVTSRMSSSARSC